MWLQVEWLSHTGSNGVFPVKAVKQPGRSVSWQGWGVCSWKCNCIKNINKKYFSFVFIYHTSVCFWLLRLDYGTCLWKFWNTPLPLGIEHSLKSKLLTQTPKLNSCIYFCRLDVFWAAWQSNPWGKLSPITVRTISVRLVSRVIELVMKRSSTKEEGRGTNSIKKTDHVHF